MKRRDLLKWAPPVILTFPVLPSFARAGSNDVEEAKEEAVEVKYRGEGERRRRRHSWWAFWR